MVIHFARFMGRVPDGLTRVSFGMRGGVSAPPDFCSGRLHERLPGAGWRRLVTLWDIRERSGTVSVDGRMDGEILREWRRSRGWDVPEMARMLRRANPDGHVPARDSLVRMVYRWEREGLAKERYKLLYARALGIDPDVLAGGPPGEAVPDHADEPTRHDFLRAGAALSLLDMLGGYAGRPALGPGVRVDGEMAAGLDNIVLGYRQVYRSAGAASLLAPVCDTLGLLTELASSAGSYRDRIVSLIGQAASLAGVILMLDQGDPAAASRYLAVAVRAARQAGDIELLAVTFGCQAFRAAYGGDTASGVEYAEEASALAAAVGAHPLTRGWTAAVASEMYATAGDEKACMRALDAAAAQLEAPVPDLPWKGIGAFSAAKLAAYRGGDLMRLRRYAQAQAELHRALAELDQAHAKHRCTAHVDLSAAFMLAGDIPEGIHHAAAALDIITVTRHADSLRRVTGLYEIAKPARTSAVRGLRSRLLEVTAAS